MAPFRAYNPAIGRWLQIDPIYKFHESGYAGFANNPVLYTDPAGLDTIAPSMNCIGCIGPPSSTVYDPSRNPKVGNEYPSILGPQADEFFEKLNPFNYYEKSPKPKDGPTSPTPETEPDDDAVFRGMKRGADGMPETGESARALGVRPGVDIAVDEDGYVNPGTGGMSVSPNSPFGLPKHRRPPGYGGTGKDPAWSLVLNNLPPGLIFVQDSPTHGTIQPASRMKYGTYKVLLEITKSAWYDAGGDTPNSN